MPVAFWRRQPFSFVILSRKPDLVRTGLSNMINPPSSRRRPSVHITLQRAARLHHLVWFLGGTPRTRESILSHLTIGLRTFYRELELLKRCGVKVRHRNKLYTLLPTAKQAEGRLPFPDPQLSFAEMAELAACPCDAGRRLADLLATVINQPPPGKKRASSTSRKKSASKKPPST
jgi:hypothetical protein